MESSNSLHIFILGIAWYMLQRGLRPSCRLRSIVEDPPPCAPYWIHWVPTPVPPLLMRLLLDRPLIPRLPFSDSCSEHQQLHWLSQVGMWRWDKLIEIAPTSTIWFEPMSVLVCPWGGQVANDWLPLSHLLDIPLSSSTNCVGNIQMKLALSHTCYIFVT